MSLSSELSSGGHFVEWIFWTSSSPSSSSTSFITVSSTFEERESLSICSRSMFIPENVDEEICLLLYLGQNATLNEAVLDWQPEYEKQRERSHQAAYHILSLLALFLARKQAFHLIADVNKHLFSFETPVFFVFSLTNKRCVSRSNISKLGTITGCRWSRRVNRFVPISFWRNVFECNRRTFKSIFNWRRLFFKIFITSVIFLSTNGDSHFDQLLVIVVVRNVSVEWRRCETNEQNRSESLLGQSIRTASVIR